MKFCLYRVFLLKNYTDLAGSAFLCCMKKLTLFLSLVIGGLLIQGSFPVSVAPSLVAPIPDCRFLPEDTVIFKQKIQSIKNQKTMVDRTMGLAYNFLNAPYVHGTLDKGAEEKLVVNLRQLDCWTFIDNTLVMAITASSPHPDFDNFVNHLRQFRYRNGVIDGYGSRIHYFSDWILNASEMGYIKDITQELGGEKLQKNISYMTGHPAFYPALKDTAVQKKLADAEARINAHDWYYIPKSKVQAMQHKIHTGDIVVFTSSKSTLDVEHQGFAIRGKDGVLRAIHASSTGKRVIISQRPLVQYLSRLPAMSGLMVLRINEPSKK